MFTYVLFKYLTWLCMPYTLAMLALVAIGVWLLCRKQRWPAVCVFGVVVFLFVQALPWTMTRVGATLERRHPPVTMDAIPQADAIVVLGGGVASTTATIPYPELNWSADRAIMALRLFRAGKAPLIIPSGGGATLAERPLFESLGVPPEAILCENESLDTAGNAEKTVAILRERGFKKVLLVTSAWHMRRSLMLFESATDITFIPVPCDYESLPLIDRGPEIAIWAKMPSPEAAGRLTYYLKEWLGILFYTLRTPSLAQERKATERNA